MIIPVILSGGAGTRLWPVSRQGYPKPFMKMADGQSLLTKTYQRAASIAKPGHIVTVTNREYYFTSKDELSIACPGAENQNIFLLEPCSRNTAAAITMASFYVNDKYGKDVSMLILPADHLIEDNETFLQLIADADSLAQQDFLVTFGIVPNTPETGFGYIEADYSIKCGRKVRRFVEKPNIETAKKYLDSGNYFWNAGMFCFKTQVLQEQLALHAPEVFSNAEKCWDNLRSDKNIDVTMLEIPEDYFNLIPDISIDYGLMERSDAIVVIPSDIGWSDIGSWNAVSQLITGDEDQNRSTGKALFCDSHNVFIHNQDRLVATLGIDNLIVIDTEDALLLLNPEHAQNVKKVVKRLKLQNHETLDTHRTVFRPWGSYTVLEEGPRFKIKRIEVKPQAKLSLQMHHHRSEHWIVVRGMAKVVNGEMDILISANESTYIPAGCAHRLENPGLLDLVMIEVQSGEYLGEDDIVRLNDQYGRC